MGKWFENKVTISVPSLWLVETTSIVHKLVRRHQITSDEAEAVLSILLDLPIKVIPEDADFCRRAYAWASTLGQFSAYDGFYLALADRLQAELYTSDKRLFNRCQQIGANFVKWME